MSILPKIMETYIVNIKTESNECDPDMMKVQRKVLLLCFTELASRPMQSKSVDVRLLCVVCLSHQCNFLFERDGYI